jgi:hypothetical protein
VDVEKTIEFILQMQAKTDATLDRLAERDAAAERRMDRSDAYMRRAVRLGAREARAERAKRKELDAKWEEKITQIAAAHLLTEEALRQLSARVDAFLAGFRSGNGHPPA